MLFFTFKNRRAFRHDSGMLLSAAQYRSPNATLAQLKNSFGVNTTIELKKYRKYILQYRHSSYSKHAPLDAGTVGCSLYIFQSNRSINTKCAIFGLCHYCIQWAICKLIITVFFISGRDILYSIGNGIWTGHSEVLRFDSRHMILYSD